MKRLLYKLLLIPLLLAAVGVPALAADRVPAMFLSARSSANLICEVMHSVRLGRNRWTAIDFGVADQETDEDEVSALERGAAASFQVSGGPFQHYLLDLPLEARMWLRGGQSIAVSDFKSSLNKAGGVLDREGNQSPRVGAKRGKLKHLEAKGGAALGYFVATVVYP